MGRTPIRRPRPPHPGGSTQYGSSGPAPVYNPDGFEEEGIEDEPVGASPLSQHTNAVREQAVNVEEEPGLSADVQLSPYSAMPADASDDDRATLRKDIERIRKIRKPLGTHSQKLALPRRTGYHRHWFNDSPGRIEQAEANGWAFIKDNEGKPISRVVGSGRGGPMRAYAMELPEIFWQEDMAARHAEATARVEAIKKSPFRAKEGTVKPEDRGKFYDPQEERGSSGPVQVENY